MQTRFAACQAVELSVPEQPVPIQHYLRQPHRLVKALTNPTQVKPLGGDCYRLTIRPLTFMTLSFQPTVDLKVWAEADGMIRLRSLACEIRGIDYINQRFTLNLVGKLYPEVKNGITLLKGRADLEVKVELPPPFNFTPAPILETTGNSLLKSVLLTIKQRLMHQLLEDYCHWARGEQDLSSGNGQLIMDHGQLLMGNRQLIVNED